MSKFDFFEEGIRRVLDNYELPLEENSWANFRTSLGAGKASNFLKVFALPGLLVAGIFGAMHMSTPKTELTHQETAEHSTVINSETTHGSTEFSSTDKVISEETIANEEDQNKDLVADAMVSANDLSSSNLKSKKSSGSQDQGVNSVDETDIEDGLNKGPMKTKYEGSNYKLGASPKFTPNNDNRNDTFMPPLLTKESVFLMRIYDRGGNIVFETKDVHNPWDGTVLNTNKPAELGDYRWNVILDLNNKREEYEGKVKLVR